ncbi:MAG: hypothetical protein QGI83_21670 [Candidatus Latescibacteria bacterium]|jgi:hypothetical protein|nr:hypothetical protein [Candidatus Latescibacterota bacterium]
MALTITKTVRPNATWQEMYLQIQKGQRVVVAADGLWSPEMRPATILWCGPDGIEGRLADDEYLVPGTNVGSLVARIGQETPPIAMGNYCEFVSVYGGPLFLAMNEKPDYHNQAGSIQAQIILFDP